MNTRGNTRSKAAPVPGRSGENVGMPDRIVGMPGPSFRTGRSASRPVCVVTALFLTLLISVHSFGDYVSAAPGRLTLEVAVQRGLLAAPSLKLVGLDVEEATLALQEAELGQLVGRPRNEYEAALRAVDDARDKYIDGLVQVALQIEEAYYDVLRTKDTLGIQQSNLEQAERQFGLTKARYDAGLIPRQDFLEAELNYDQTVRSVEAGSRQHELAVQRLGRLIAHPDGTSLTVEGGVTSPTWSISLDVALAEALERRAEIVRARREIAQAEGRVAQAESPYAAPIELQKANIVLARAELQLAQTVTEIETEVRSQWHALVDLSLDIEEADRREQLALGRAEISRARHAAGTIALLELLEDEAGYAKARQDAVSAVWNYNLARARFLRTLGRPELPPLPTEVAAYIDGWTDGQQAEGSASGGASEGVSEAEWGAGKGVGPGAGPGEGPGAGKGAGPGEGK